MAACSPWAMARSRRAGHAQVCRLSSSTTSATSSWPSSRPKRRLLPAEDRDAAGHRVRANPGLALSPTPPTGRRIIEHDFTTRQRTHDVDRYPDAGGALRPAGSAAEGDRRRGRWPLEAALQPYYSRPQQKPARYYQEIAINRAVQSHSSRAISGVCCSRWPPAPARRSSRSRLPGSCGTPVGARHQSAVRQAEDPLSLGPLVCWWIVPKDGNLFAPFDDARCTRSRARPSRAARCTSRSTNPSPRTSAGPVSTRRMRSRFLRSHQ